MRFKVFISHSSALDTQVRRRRSTTMSSTESSFSATSNISRRQLQYSFVLLTLYLFYVNPLVITSYVLFCLCFNFFRAKNNSVVLCDIGIKINNKRITKYRVMTIFLINNYTNLCLIYQTMTRYFCRYYRHRNYIDCTRVHWYRYQAISTTLNGT